MDHIRLEYEMKRKGVSIAELCKALNMSRTAFYRKSRGMSEFNRAEILAIVDYLELSTPMDIFFPEFVS